MVSEHPARTLYREGRKFRVLRDGARLEGIVTFGTGGTAWAGFSRVLKVGDVITCLGWKPMMGTPQEGVNFESDTTPENAVWSTVWPLNGLFQPFPMEGFLEWVPSADDDETGWPEIAPTEMEAFEAHEAVEAAPAPVEYTTEQLLAREVWETMRGQEEVSLVALRRRVGTSSEVVTEIRRLLAAEVMTKVLVDGGTWLRKGPKFLKATTLIAGRENAKS